MKYTKLLIVIVAVVLAFAFIIKGSTEFDPDFGYRVTTGMQILTTGIPRTDPYSYTMPSFTFVEHSFLIAVLWELMYPVTGYAGLAGIQTLIVCFTLIVLYVHANHLLKTHKASLNPFASSALLLFTAITLLTFFGVRAQVISWLFFALLFSFLYPHRRWKKTRRFIPFFFMLWANTHGSFIAGLGLLTSILVTRTLMSKRITVIDVGILLSSYLLTLVNPYGVGMWHESLASITDANMRTYIYEWMPPFLSITLAIGTYTALTLVLIARYFRKFPRDIQVLVIVTFLAACSSTRNVPIFILSTTPLLLQSLGILLHDISTIAHAKTRVISVAPYAVVALTILLTIQVYFDIRTAQTMSEQVAFPQEAIAYLKENQPTGEIFSQFYWGGYLRLYYPEKRVFIDGRMTSWRNPDAPVSESTAAFTDYVGILSGEQYQGQFEKYGIDTVLWSTPLPLKEQQSQSPLAPIVNQFIHEESEPPIGIIAAIERDGWDVVYRDEVATIYRKQP